MELETKFYVAGTPLEATIHIPDKGNESAVQGKVDRVPPGIACLMEKYPTVLLCHGYGSYRNHGWGRLAKALGDNGFASLRFDHRGAGVNPSRRHTPRPSSEGPYDARSAIDYCESLPFVDKERIGITGGSMGGIMSIIMAATDSRIKSAAPMACTANCGENIRKDWGDSADAFMEEMRKDARLTAATGLSRIINMADDIGLHRKEGVGDANIIASLLLPGISPYVTLESIRDLIDFNATDYISDVQCPIFIIHGADDGLNAEDHPRRLYNALPESNKNKRIKIYPDVDHSIFDCVNSEAVVRDIVDWFSETLKD
ncbi:MAG: alpha/beta fold hydrolase [Clostridiales bacterium]|jgi:alpha-beta hydrolase superfamily lysophospholipase|nr:alpha/beta fold hydrolase [Clostridiales bacterium]